MDEISEEITFGGMFLVVSGIRVRFSFTSFSPRIRTQLEVKMKPTCIIVGEKPSP